jgi:hypothetical protein
MVNGIDNKARTQNNSKSCHLDTTDVSHHLIMVLLESQYNFVTTVINIENENLIVFYHISVIYCLITFADILRAEKAWF